MCEYVYNNLCSFIYLFFFGFSFLNTSVWDTSSLKIRPDFVSIFLFFSIFFSYGTEGMVLVIRFYTRDHSEITIVRSVYKYYFVIVYFCFFLIFGFLTAQT